MRTFCGGFYGIAACYLWILAEEDFSGQMGQPVCFLLSLQKECYVPELKSIYEDKNPIIPII